MLSKLQIELYANQLRENIGLDECDIVGNIVKIINDARYKYFEESFSNDFSGFCKVLGPHKFLIGFNTDHYWNDNFKRFTLSHELGHINIPRHLEIITNSGEHYSKVEYSSKSEIEKEADYFAINFLAPKKCFEDLLKDKDFSQKSIISLSKHFKISLYATAIHFIEVTDLNCVLIVSNKNTGLISYELRSKKMKDSFSYSFIDKQKISPSTLTNDYIDGRTAEDTCETDLNEWYRELPIEIGAIESVINLGYNGIILTLLTPHVSHIDDHIAENTF